MEIMNYMYGEFQADLLSLRKWARMVKGSMFIADFYMIAADLIHVIER